MSQNFHCIAEGRRKKEEGKVLLCLSFQLLNCPNLSFDCYMDNSIFTPPYCYLFPDGFNPRASLMVSMRLVERSSPSKILSDSLTNN
ncbi:MAG: hypothetical protein F6K48_12850 [Okeania sp. SIO3H1]|uniref:hypothetical protein n=1 Tax=Okeania sp. SIO1I7 TaxID=2607772 RepID=UPI0013C824E5|nr:hypothetical protein [Okeania sp. SIO1I7]NEN89743.1 hypothetical protein [Okeania sp. SIO3H1]NET23956.1 hypothetical protein [Okeania sp. SIO1I7]